MHKQDVLFDFIGAEKPLGDGLTGSDVSVMIVLLDEWMKSTGNIVSISRAKLSRRSGASTSAVDDRLRNLKKLGWIDKHSGKHGADTNSFEILHEKLPKIKPEPKIEVSEKAMQLAALYKTFFLQSLSTYISKNKHTGQERQRKRKLPRRWKERWSRIFQQKIDSLGLEVVVAFLDSATDEAANKRGAMARKAAIGPQALPWPEKEAQ